MNVFTISEYAEQVHNENVFCPGVYIMGMHCSKVYGISGLSYSLLTLFKWNPVKIIKIHGQAIWIEKW